MSTRREIMNYIGTGAIGGIAGYYVGAQELLGIQSDEVVQRSIENQPTENSPTEDPATEDPPTEDPPTEEPPAEDANTGSNVLDDFEDSQLNWEITEGERSDLAFADESAHGSQSLYFEDSSNRVIIRKNLTEVNQPQFLSYWFKYRSQRDNNFRVSLFDGNNNKIIEVREFNQTVHYKNSGGGGVTSQPIANIDQEVWYRVELSDIDFESQTLSISVKNANGATVGSVTGISFWNSVSEVGYIRLVNGLEARSGQPGAADPLWIDHIILRPLSDDTTTESANTDSEVSIYDDFEDGNLDSPEWVAEGGGPGGLAPENEIGITENSHSGNYALYLDQGGSLSNFWAVSELNRTVSPSKIVMWTQPAGADQYTKNKLVFTQNGTSGIYMNNHIQNDGFYFRFREGNDESDRRRVRDSSISPDVGRFVEIRLEQIDWENGTVGEVFIDKESIATDAPFVNQVDGFDTVRFAAVGGGGTVFYMDDIGWA